LLSVTILISVVRLANPNSLLNKINKRWDWIEWK